MTAIFVVVIIMALLGMIHLSDLWTQVAASLLTTALVLGYLAFKPEIDKWLDSKRSTIETDNNRRIHIAEHCNKIAREYIQFASKKIRYVESTWEEYLQDFRYRKELLQHLITGHRQIYDLYEKTVQSEKSFREIFNHTISEINEKVRQAKNELGIPQNPVEGQQPTFSEEYIVRHIVEEIHVDNWTGFSADRDVKGGRVIKSNDRSFRTNYFDKRLLDSLVLRLNDIVQSSEVRAEMERYRNAQGIKDTLEADFKSEFDDLLRGIELGGKNLMGACEPCYELQDEEDKPKFQPLLSQVK